jgi:hypothetical protein
MSEQVKPAIVETPQNQSPVGKLAKALAKAQGEFANPTKDTNNPFFKTKYADLAACINATKDTLAKNGLAVCQCLEVSQGMPLLNTKLLHESGEFVESKYMLTKDANPQKFGSQLTYARRYSYAAIVGIAQEDDDAQHASNSVKKTTPSSPAPVGPANDIKTPVIDALDRALGGETITESPLFEPTTDSGSGSLFDDDKLTIYQQCCDFKIDMGKRDHPNFGKKLEQVDRASLHKFQGWLEKLPNPDEKATAHLWHVKQYLILDKEFNR